MALNLLMVSVMVGIDVSDWVRTTRTSSASRIILFCFSLTGRSCTVCPYELTLPLQRGSIAREIDEREDSPVFTSPDMDTQRSQPICKDCRALLYRRLSSLKVYVAYKINRAIRHG